MQPAGFTAPSPPAPPATRTLVPHEHGAYGQLAMPLVTALAIGRITIAAVALAVAIVLAFVAHESLLVVIGQRGKRALEGDGPRARRLLAWLGGGTLLLGGAGLVLAPGAARLALAVPLVLGAGVAWLVLRRLEKTILGEILVAAALSSAAMAVALAGGVTLPVALGCWMTWVLAFAAATLAVQVVLVRARSKGRRDPGWAHAASGLALVLAGFGATHLAGAPRATALAILPTALLSIAVCLSRVSPHRLRELGWAMVGASALTMVILIAGLR